jgi:hypothetical protein
MSTKEHKLAATPPHPHPHHNNHQQRQKSVKKLRVSSSAPIKITDDEDAQDVIKTVSELTRTCETYRNELQKQKGT